MQIDFSISENHLREMFFDLEECFLLADKEQKILMMNKKAASLLGDPSSLADIEHLIGFDVCILNREELLSYTPLKAAVISKQIFKSEVLIQLSETEYRKLCLKSFKNGENTVIILSNHWMEEENSKNKFLIQDYRKRVNELESNTAEFIRLQGQAQNLAVRTGLINRISNSIRESLEPEKIIEIALYEISTSLGIDKSYFAILDKDKDALKLKAHWNLSPQDQQEFQELLPDYDFGIEQAFNAHKTTVSAVMTDQKTGKIQPRLITPVLHMDEMFGILVFYHTDNKKIWHEEEISLIEGLTSQIGSAFNQAKLFETILKQKNELERAILKLKETQSQLIQSEKMASLGQLIAGVAHEINTPIGSINSNNNIISKCMEKIMPELKDVEIAEIIQDSLSTSKEAIRRIDNLVKSLKNFARLDEADYQQADIHEGINNTILLINHELKGNINVVKDFGLIPRVKCYPNQLNQVFMNILINACQSIKDKGEILIKTEQEGEFALISISDTGVGIPANVLRKIFDPGFTTKGVGVGTGLGLSICYQIIEKHKGRISVESEVNKGTTFKIKLPL